MGKDLRGKDLGKGFSQRSDGRYEARVMVRGQKIHLYNNSLKDLKQEFAKAKEELENDVNIKYQNVTVDEWFQEWFERYKKPSLKPSSAYPTVSRYNSIFKEHIGHLRLVDLRGAQIQSAIVAAQNAGRARSSIRSAVSTVRDCFKIAQNNNIIRSNPAVDVLLPWGETKPTLQRCLDKEERIEFLEEASNTYYKELYYVMLLTGLRIGEVGGLFWSDIDFKQKVIHVNRSLHCQYHNGVKTQVMTDPKTVNSFRSIPFMGEVEEMLKSWKVKQNGLKKALGSRWRVQGDYDDVVFTSSMGSLITRYIVEKEINKIVANVNAKRLFEGRPQMEKIYPHALRHTFCSMCFERGMQPKVVQMIMGHANFSTTMNIYTHVVGAVSAEDAAKFGTSIFDEQEDDWSEEDI